jgi:hypothetical protein
MEASHIEGRAPDRAILRCKEFPLNPALLGAELDLGIGPGALLLLRPDPPP